MEFTTLSNGARIPMEGFGVFRIPDQEECYQSVLDAIKAGYRLIDTATAYQNEEAVGRAVKEAIREGIVKREDLFITSKMWVADMGSEKDAALAIDRSLKKLGLEYMDMYLLHQAMRDYFAAWRSMENAYQAGKIRCIGVSNFYAHTLTNFCETVDMKPVVDQIETHPYYTREKELETFRYYHVQPEAWAPLGGGRYKPFDNPMLKEIAEAHGKSIGQVVLRWNVQRGVIVIPKSTHKERIIENFDIWDFTLTDEEMKKISSLDMGYVGTAVKHFDPDFVRGCLGVTKHE